MALTQKQRESFLHTAKLVGDRSYFWEVTLLEMRQDDSIVAHEGSEVFISGEEWRRRFLKRYGKDVPLDIVRRFYGSVVGSYLESCSGKVKDANQFLRCMVDADSQGRKKRLEVLEWAGWIAEACLPKEEKTTHGKKKGVRKSNEQRWEEERQRKLKRVPQEVRDKLARYVSDNPKVMHPVGHKPLWSRQCMNGDEVWVGTLLEDVEAKLKDAQDDVVGTLREMGVLPVCRPALRVFTGPSRSNVLWEASAFDRAVGNLLKWESWRHRVVSEVEKMEGELHKHGARGAVYEGQLDALREKFPDMMPRAIRGWNGKNHHPGLYTVLRDGTPEEGLKYLGKIPYSVVGDRRILTWLCCPEQAYLTHHPEGDIVRWFSELNEMKWRISIRKKLPTWRFTNRLDETGKVDIPLDGPSNRNLPQFAIHTDGKGIRLTIPTLKTFDGELKSSSEVVVAAPTRRLRGLTLRNEDESVVATFESQDRTHMVSGTVQGGLLQCRDGEFRLQVAIRVDAENAPLKLARYWNSSLHKRDGQEPPPLGTLILSAHLGVRNAVGCTVHRWEGPSSPPKRVRSFLLLLPGDRPSSKEVLHRQKHMGLLKDARKMMNQLSALKAKVREGTVPPDEYRGYEDSVAQMVSMIRSGYGLRKRGNGGYLSAWRVKYLEEVRALLQSWSDHLHPPKDGVQRSKVGMCRALDTHITNLRKDRAKKTADMIVQASRGYVYILRQRRWVRKYDPVAVLLIDGIHQYRARLELPPGENKTLVRWRHRMIAEYVKYQAEVHGIAVMEGVAAHTSTFHSVSRSPGMRCHALSAIEARAVRSKLGLWGLIGWPDEMAGLLRAGHLVPLPGGETFVTRSNGGHLKVNAEVNAANTIGRWHLEGYSEPVRVEANEAMYKGEKSGLLVTVLEEKARSRGGFGYDAVVLKPVPFEEGVYEVVDQGTVKRVLKKARVELSSAKRTLYRDPSGVFWPDDRWVLQGKYWDVVRGGINKYLQDVVRDGSK